MIFACADPATMERLVNRRRDRLSPLQYRRFAEALLKLNTERLTTTAAAVARRLLPH